MKNVFILVLSINNFSYHSYSQGCVAIKTQARQVQGDAAFADYCAPEEHSFKKINLIEKIIRKIPLQPALNLAGKANFY